MSAFNDANELASELVHGRNYQTNEPCETPKQLIFVNGNSIITVKATKRTNWGKIANRIECLFYQGYRHVSSEYYQGFIHGRRSMIMPPTEVELKRFQLQYHQLADILATKGGLKDKGIHVLRQLLTYLLKKTGVDSVLDITTAQWKEFYAYTGKMLKQKNGAKALVSEIQKVGRQGFARRGLGNGRTQSNHFTRFDYCRD